MKNSKAVFFSALVSITATKAAVVQAQDPLGAPGSAVNIQQAATITPAPPLDLPTIAPTALPKVTAPTAVSTVGTLEITKDRNPHKPSVVKTKSVVKPSSEKQKVKTVKVAEKHLSNNNKATGMVIGRHANDPQFSADDAATAELNSSARKEIDTFKAKRM